MVDVQGASIGAIGLGPYGDESEHTGPPEVITIPDVYRPFFATDARSVMITLLPQHYNLIPNPSFRTGTSGWKINGTYSLVPDSWVGQALSFTGDGSLQYKQSNGATNLLTDNQANGSESGTLPTTSDTPAMFVMAGTGASSTAYAYSGSRSIAVTASSVSAGLNFGSNSGTIAADGRRIAVTPGVAYTATAMVLAPSATRVMYALFYWFNAAGTNIASTPKSLVTASPAWQRLTSTLVAPADAAYLGVRFYAASSAAGEVFYFDSLGVWAGDGGEWAMPGEPIMTDDNPNFVYVGPLNGTQENQWDPKRGGPEYTFSVFVKGAGDVRLNMDAYYPEDRLDLTSGPEYQGLNTVANPATASATDPVVLGGDGNVWTLIDPAPPLAPYYESLGRPPAFESANGQWNTVDDDGQWHRVVLKTRARVLEGEGKVSFVGARWIDLNVEIRNANGLKISSLMLDPTEYPVCDYFDGDMTENLSMDDFIWEDQPNDSVSYYYIDRIIRTKWLYERMGFVVPAGRPYQIFFGSYWRPYVGKTGETILMEIPPPA